MIRPLLQRLCGVALLTIGALTAPVLAQVESGSAALEQSAWKALDAGQLDAAAAAFREAIAANPNNARLHLGLAVVAYARREDAEATAAVDRALALEPRLPLAREILGRLQYRSGALEHAIRTFEDLIGDGGNAALVDTLNRWRSEIELRNRMFVAVGAGVSVAFEGPQDEDLAKQAVASLERASARIGATLAHYPGGSVPVVLYTRDQFHDITRSPAWAGGAFDGTIRVPMRGALANPAELDRVLAHEYIHAVVRDLAPRGVPAWLNEGLAAALEREDRAPPPATLALPLRELEGSFRGMTGDEAQRAYAASAFAVQRMLDQAGGPALTDLLRDLGDGVPFETAFASRMQMTFSDFEASLERR